MPLMAHFNLLMGAKFSASPLQGVQAGAGEEAGVGEEAGPPCKAGLRWMRVSIVMRGRTLGQTGLCQRRQHSAHSSSASSQ
jgi:hypothetical protein